MKVNIIILLFVGGMLLWQCGQSPKSYAEKTKELAESGNADAQLRLALMYKNGDSLRPNQDKAQKWFLASAKQGNAKAQFYMGLMEYTAKHYKDARKWLEQSEVQDHDDTTQFYLGLTQYRISGYDDVTISWFEKAMNQGHEQARMCLSECYYQEALEKKENNEDIQWLFKASNLGHLAAQCELGRRYAEGTGGVVENREESIKWYTKAALGGSDIAQVCMGALYYYGNGVKRDKAESVKWYTMAAERNNAQALYKLGQIYMEKGELKNVQTAKYWLQKAAQVPGEIRKSAKDLLKQIEEEERGIPVFKHLVPVAAPVTVGTSNTKAVKLKK